MLRDPRKELTREPHIAGRKSIFSPSSNVAEPTKPIPVEIRQPDLEPLELVRSVVGPLLQPLAVSGLVIVFIIMILGGPAGPAASPQGVGTTFIERPRQ